MARILVVDDEAIFNELLPAALEREGHDVRSSDHGAEAVELGRTFRPEILVADWMLMNRLTGIDVARRLANEIPGLITILITGHPVSAMKDEIDETIARVLHKPFDLATLRSTIDELLAQA